MLVTQLRNILKDPDATPGAKVKAAKLLLDIEKRRPGVTRPKGRPKKVKPEPSPEPEVIPQAPKPTPELSDHLLTLLQESEDE